MGRYSHGYMGWHSYGYGRPYVPAAARRRQAAKTIAKMEGSGRELSPVEIAGRKIALTFWGAAWCKNLEAYSDYSNRLPRGRTYVRNGSVLDLQIEAGRVRALVSGRDLYTVDIEIKPLPKKKWSAIKGHCAGQIGSLVELLQGSISSGVMEIVTRQGEGLFPSPREISLGCSCPDWATMCKHVAATLYGVGARLDHDPELLFTLRKVDPTEMVEAAIDQPPTGDKPRRGRALETEELSSVFGVDIDMGGVSPVEASTPTKPARTTKRAAKPRKAAPSRASKKKAGAKPASSKSAFAKSAAKKTAAKKTAAKKKSSSNSLTSRKTAAKKTAAKKTAAKKKSSSNSLTSRKTAAKKATTKKVAAKKTAAKKTAAKKKGSANRTTPKKTPAKKKSSANRTTPKKTPAKKTARKKMAARKTAGKKATAKKHAAKNAASKTSRRKPAAKKATKKAKS